MYNIEWLNSRGDGILIGAIYKVINMNFVDVINELNKNIYLIQKIRLYNDILSDKYIEFDNFSDFIEYIQQNKYDRRKFNTYYKVENHIMLILIL